MEKNEKKEQEPKFDDNVETKTRNMSEVVQEKLDQLKDLASLEVMMETPIRMQHRMRAIEELASARHIKIRGNWKTYPPKMHITKLKGQLINNDEAEITFSVYETDKNGNKKLFTQENEVELRDGSKIKQTTNAEYRIAYDVVERVKSGKPITREIIRVNK